jgi:hypothetical protein
MRVMVLIKATPSTEAGEMPTEKLLTDMGNFNQQMIDAGIMLAGDGLRPTADGAIVRVSGDKRTVERGPFADAPGKRVCGFWILKVKDLDEAIAWIRKVPSPYREDGEIELRPLYETEDFAEFAPDIVEKENAQRQQIERQQKR